MNRSDVTAEEKIYPLLARELFYMMNKTPRDLPMPNWKFSKAWKKCDCNNSDIPPRFCAAHPPRIFPVYVYVCYMREKAASRSKNSRHVSMTTRCARSKMIPELFTARRDNGAVSWAVFWKPPRPGIPPSNLLGNYRLKNGISSMCFAELGINNTREGGNTTDDIAEKFGKPTLRQI